MSARAVTLLGIPTTKLDRALLGQVLRKQYGVITRGNHQVRHDRQALRYRVRPEDLGNGAAGDLRRGDRDDRKSGRHGGTPVRRARKCDHRVCRLAPARVQSNPHHRCRRARSHRAASPKHGFRPGAADGADAGAVLRERQDSLRHGGAGGGRRRARPGQSPAGARPGRGFRPGRWCRVAELADGTGGPVAGSALLRRVLARWRTGSGPGPRGTFVTWSSAPGCRCRCSTRGCTRAGADRGGRCLVAGGRRRGGG